LPNNGHIIGTETKHNFIVSGWNIWELSSLPLTQLARSPL